MTTSTNEYVHTYRGMEREDVRDRLLEQTWSSPHLCAKFTYDKVPHHFTMLNITRHNRKS